MKYSAGLVAALAAGTGSFVAPAYANSLQPAPQSAPAMEEVVLNATQRTVVLDRLANEINRQMRGSDSPGTTVDEVLQSPLIDGLLDENGELNLPLGLTVYDAMGTTSIGFGSKF